MKFKWLLVAGFFVMVSAPFWWTDNTARSYLDLDDLRDPPTIMHGYQRFFSGLSGNSATKSQGPTLKRWVDERGIVHIADAESKGVPQDSETVDFSKFTNTNFIAMEGHGSTQKALLVYGALFLVGLLALRYGWQALKGAGSLVVGGAKIKIPGEQFKAIEFKPGTDASHTILGISEDASDEDIKHAYRKKMSLFHPDKVANMSDAVRDQALAQAKLVNVAYKDLSERSK